MLSGLGKLWNDVVAALLVSTSKPRPIYCSGCGAQLVHYRKPYQFDQQTGEPVVWKNTLTCPDQTKDHAIFTGASWFDDTQGNEISDPFRSDDW